MGRRPRTKIAEVSQLPDDAAARDVLPIGNVCRRDLPLQAPFDEITRVVDAARHGQADRSPRPPIDLHQYHAIIRRFLVLHHRDAFESDLSDQTTAVHTAEAAQRRNPFVPVPADLNDLKKLPVNARLRGKLRQIRPDLDSQGGLKFHRMDKADRSVLERFYRSFVVEARCRSGKVVPGSASQLSGSDAVSGKGAAQSLGRNQPDPRGQAFRPSRGFGRLAIVAKPRGRCRNRGRVGCSNADSRL